VARDKAQATVVDTHALGFYKEIKGAVFAKNLRGSPGVRGFPPAVIVYRQGGVAEQR